MISEKITELVIATNNQHKLVEFKQLFTEAKLDITVFSLRDLGIEELPKETGSSFRENALIKAEFVAAKTGLPTLADDSGISVDILNGMPGIFSARWAGTHGDDVANLQLLLKQLADIENVKQRTAKYVCALAYVVPQISEQLIEEYWEGYIAPFPQGKNGFGYDPVFVPRDGNEGQSTVAELSEEFKRNNSHRAKALNKFLLNFI